MRKSAPFAFLSVAVFAAPLLRAQSSELIDTRPVVALAADSIAARLRASGRLHLYLSPTVACDSTLTANCAAITSLALETFSTTAIAGVTQPGQRWPTLCDNSDEIRLSVPSFSFDTAQLSATSVHSNRTTLLQEGQQHTVILAKAAGRWSVVTFTSADTSFAGEIAAQPPNCAWSLEPDNVVRSPDRAAGARAASGSAIPINSEESCPWCTLASRPLRKLGQPTDANNPREGALVFAGARAGAASSSPQRFFVQSSVPGQLLLYDSTGASTTVLGSFGRGRGEFQSTDAVAVDAQDSVYVIDNQQRRVTVFAPSLEYVRQFQLPWPIDAFWILRDGRLLTARTPSGYGDPVAIHSSRGEVIRSFGAPLGKDGLSCVDCGVPVVSMAPSGYRLWLAWSNRYQLEEWDLGGRRTAVLEKNSTSLGPIVPSGARRPGSDPIAQAQVARAPGIRKLVSGADGTLWVVYGVRDQLGALTNMVDVLDPVRGRLVKTLVGASMDHVVSDGIRSLQRVNEFGFSELSLESYELDRRRGGK